MLGFVKRNRLPFEILVLLSALFTVVYFLVNGRSTLDEHDFRQNSIYGKKYLLYVTSTSTNENRIPQILIHRSEVLFHGSVGLVDDFDLQDFERDFVNCNSSFDKTFKDSHITKVLAKCKRKMPRKLRTCLHEVCAIHRIHFVVIDVKVFATYFDFFTSNLLKNRRFNLNVLLQVDAESNQETISLLSKFKAVIEILKTKDRFMELNMVEFENEPVVQVRKLFDYLVLEDTQTSSILINELFNMK